MQRGLVIKEIEGQKYKIPMKWSVGHQTIERFSPISFGLEQRVAYLCATYIV
jgi:hypothetical protein